MTKRAGETASTTEKGETMSTKGTRARGAGTDVSIEATESTAADEAATESNGAVPDEAEDAADGKRPSSGVDKSSKRLSVSLSVRSLVVSAVILALAAGCAVLGWLYLDATDQLHVQRARAANDTKAEQIALDYAVSAATMDYKDLQGWKVKLVAGTSPELSRKLSDAGTSMEQVLVPLQWSSTAKPLVAKVRSDAGGVYVVDSFVSVQTKTVQSADPLQSTATYSTTIDSNNGWQITDVGGISSVMAPK